MLVECKHCGAKDCISRGRRGGLTDIRKRWQCKVCGRTFTTESDQDRRKNKLGDELDVKIRQLLSEGKSIRAISRETGVGRHAICVRRVVDNVPSVRRKVEWDECDQCGTKIGKKEFHRRTRRTKHKFCSQKCCNSFYRQIRKNDTCKRCGIKRYEQSTETKHLIRGYCNRCYCLLQMFNFDPELAEQFELTQHLKKEISSVRTNDHQKHSRLAQDAH